MELIGWEGLTSHFKRSYHYSHFTSCDRISNDLISPALWVRCDGPQPTANWVMRCEAAQFPVCRGCDQSQHSQFEWNEVTRDEITRGEVREVIYEHSIVVQTRALYDLRDVYVSAMASCLSVCLSVHLCVTKWCFSEKAEHVELIFQHRCLIPRLILNCISNKYYLLSTIDRATLSIYCTTNLQPQQIKPMEFEPWCITGLASIPSCVRATEVHRRRHCWSHLRA